MWRPNEENVRKHLREVRATDEACRQLKETVKVLNKEDQVWGNKETIRPKK